MTRFLLHLLLWSVFFNTAIGSPAHEAGHLRHLGEAVAGAHADGSTESPDHEGVHALCEWCHAHAQAFAPVATPHGALPRGAAPDRFATPASDPLVRSARPWTCATRDPPRA